MCAGWLRRSDVVNGPVVERIELPVRTLASVEAMAERLVDDPQFRRALVSLLIRKQLPTYTECLKTSSAVIRATFNDEVLRCYGATTAAGKLRGFKTCPVIQCLCGKILPKTCINGF